MSPKDREKRREERNRKIVERMLNRRPYSVIMKEFKELQKKAGEK
jgi:hypothetical protein